MGTALFNYAERMPLAEAAMLAEQETLCAFLASIEDHAMRARQAQLRGQVEEAAKEGRLIDSLIQGFVNGVTELARIEAEAIRHDPESFRSRAMQHGGC